MNKITVSCIGLGGRGNIYLSLMHEKKECYEVVSICDRNQERLAFNKELLNLKDSDAFLDDKEFFSKKRSDLLLICTSDKDHVKNMLDALNAGYKNILVEKPFATTYQEIKIVQRALKKHPDVKVYVCHVLRYAPAFLKAKEYLDSGAIGKLISIDALERVGIYHHAHSFVRGNYGVKAYSSPMILAKCCHDLDLLVWYAGSLCDSLSSIGELNYFRPENMPKGASKRCDGCIHSKDCLFYAPDLYQKRIAWAREYVTDTRPVTDEAVNASLKNNKFGRCVYQCGNDVVDDQTVQISFKNGIKASLHMTSFTPGGGRRYHFYGTEGEVMIDEQIGKIMYRRKDGYLEENEISSLISSKEGHGGGDYGLVNTLYQIINGVSSPSCTSIELSLESHIMALKAEDSRLRKGKLLKV